jgi:hypothetical protein
MAHLNVKQILEATAGLIESRPGGIRFSEIFEWFRKTHPEIPEGTLSAQIGTVVKVFPHRVTKVGRGLYAPTTKAMSPSSSTEIVTKFKEEDFYEAFAEYLQDDLDEVVKAASLGGAGMKSKWGTPDVIGVYRPTAKDLIKFNPEIVSAEIKISPSESITAFGQAVSYRLFSAKSYVVMPNTMSETDKSRLEAVAMLFGIGLVMFSLDPTNPAFEIRVRAQRSLPDMFYVNEFADRLKEIDVDAFETLFG